MVDEALAASETCHDQKLQGRGRDIILILGGRRGEGGRQIKV
jgi:hypothetical protein